MSDEYQLRKDIDFIHRFANELKQNQGLFLETDNFKKIEPLLGDNGSSSSGDMDIDNVDVDFTYDFGVRGVQDTIDINIFLKKVGE